MMNRNTIGVHAGVIWRLLDDNKRWEDSELRKASGLSDRDLNAAIGWLACENKIQFLCDKDNDKEYLYLELNYYIG